jgi:hypothetical protein
MPFRVTGMKNLKSIAVFTLTFALASPVSALGVTIKADASASTSGSSVKIGAAVETRIANAKDRANKEIERRTNALNDLATRIQAMSKLSADAKSSLTASLQSEITSLAALKAKIDAETEIALLKEDIQSIATSYRVFLLVIPQTHIMVAADKIKSTADSMTALASKLSVRIDAAAAEGKDVEALKASLDDMLKKIAEANAQADASISAVATLTPDGGDKAKQTANQQALKDARAEIKTALRAIVAARKDAGTLVKGLAALTVETSVQATTTSQ